MCVHFQVYWTCRCDALIGRLNWPPARISGNLWTIWQFPSHTSVSLCFILAVDVGIALDQEPNPALCRICCDADKAKNLHFQRHTTDSCRTDSWHFNVVQWPWLIWIVSVVAPNNSKVASTNKSCFTEEVSPVPKMYTEQSTVTQVSTIL